MKNVPNKKIRRKWSIISETKEFQKKSDEERSRKKTDQCILTRFDTNETDGDQQRIGHISCSNQSAKSKILRMPAFLLLHKLDFLGVVTDTPIFGNQ